MRPSAGVERRRILVRRPRRVNEKAPDPPRFLDLFRGVPADLGLQGRQLLVELARALAQLGEPLAGGLHLAARRDAEAAQRGLLRGVEALLALLQQAHELAELLGAALVLEELAHGLPREVRALLAQAVDEPHE